VSVWVEILFKFRYGLFDCKRPVVVKF